MLKQGASDAAIAQYLEDAAIPRGNRPPASGGAPSMVNMQAQAKAIQAQADLRKQLKDQADAMKEQLKEQAELMKKQMEEQAELMKTQMTEQAEAMKTLLEEQRKEQEQEYELLQPAHQYEHDANDQPCAKRRKTTAPETVAPANLTTAAVSGGTPPGPPPRAANTALNLHTVQMPMSAGVDSKHEARSYAGLHLNVRGRSPPPRATRSSDAN